MHENLEIAFMSAWRVLAMTGAMIKYGLSNPPSPGNEHITTKEIKKGLFTKRENIFSKTM